MFYQVIFVLNDDDHSVCASTVSLYYILHFFVEVSADKKSPDVTVRDTTMLIYSIDGSHRLVTPEGREIADEHNHIVNYRVW